MNKLFEPDDNFKKESKFGKWHVSRDGDMSYLDPDKEYHIDDDQLKDVDWIIHLCEKPWINFNEFIPAYFQALKNAGIQFIKMQVYY